MSFEPGRGPWPPLRRAVLDAMKDGEPHWADELYHQLGQPRRNGVVATLNWLVRHGFAVHSGYVTVEDGRSESRRTLTAQGLEHARNLEAGYGPSDYREPPMPLADATRTDDAVGAAVIGSSPNTRHHKIIGALPNDPMA
ncbi:hypothetical protein [Nocardia sp. BMG51109]|uniref:hypothetical protein n=1 Tax=Nocardia sp. BMG51109 TaxID=1056816 RepID=UPI0004655C06|nr:hypothetical protein [Nocardia sp. BMG51109]